MPIESTIPRWLILGILHVLVVCMPQQMGRPTLEQVEDAVENCIGLTAANDQARARLQEWGNDALPALEAMLGTSDSGRLHSVVVALGTIATPDAVSLLVEQLDRMDADRAIGSGHVLPTLEHLVRKPDGRALVRDTERLKTAVTRHLRNSPLSSTRSAAARLIGAMQWEDKLPEIRGLLHDPNLHVREVAAEVLHDLTGERANIARPATAFPSEDIDAALLQRIGTLPDGSTSFGVWKDHSAVLFHCPRVPRIDVIDANLRPVGTIKIFGTARDYAHTPPQHASLLVMLLEQPLFRLKSETVLGVSLDGEERWRRSVDGGNLESVTWLYRSGSPTGIVLGRGADLGVVALDEAGDELWSVPDPVAFEVRSHPDLDCVAICGATMLFVDPSGQEIGQADMLVTDPARSSQSFFFARHAQLFPDTNGMPAVVAAGDGENSTPTIVKRDMSGGTDWLAAASERLVGLAMVEPAASSRLFVAVTEVRELLVFDEHGTLRHRNSTVRIEDPLDGRGSGVRSLKAGRLGNGWAVALETFGETILFRLNL